MIKREQDHTCEFCYYEFFDDKAYPCSRCVCNQPTENMWRAKIKDEPNFSEKPNNCEHITEDGVTCAKYPACDDCPDNPLNKVKGFERLLKGKTEPQERSK